MGAGPSEGNWLYMNTINLGGGNHMFNAEKENGGLRVKTCVMFLKAVICQVLLGFKVFQKNEEVAHNLQCKSIGWGAQYMLAMS